jgi:hypothetical protein
MMSEAPANAGMADSPTPQHENRNAAARPHLRGVENGPSPSTAQPISGAMVSGASCSGGTRQTSGTTVRSGAGQPPEW